jgi:hypothetical chaperone protein
VGQVKRALSEAERATFRFGGAGLSIEAEVTRADFEGWIAPDVAAIAGALEAVLAKAGIGAGAVDRVFLTGGSSLIPCIRRLFEGRFGAERLAMGDELTSIAHGLALIGAEPDLSAWVA